jgi:hypothetical protein
MPVHHDSLNAAGGLRFYLRRVRINQGGYDDSGYYWGRGGPLFYYESDGTAGEDELVTGYIRADDRADAKEHIEQFHPSAMFVR